jgi:hypothetical protein
MPEGKIFLKSYVFRGFNLSSLTGINATRVPSSSKNAFLHKFKILSQICLPLGILPDPLQLGHGTEPPINSV